MVQLKVGYDVQWLLLLLLFLRWLLRRVVLVHRFSLDHRIR